ncbi:MAG: hypothetical protein IPP86_06705 [Bacteroidetes bacterium]|nr:hypothetical protein [Bacteroidota bacterium]
MKEKILQPFHLAIHGFFFFALRVLGDDKLYSQFCYSWQGELCQPVDPMCKLVIAGLYKYSRNPMYVGVVSMLVGEAVFFQSGRLGVYSIVIFLIFTCSFFSSKSLV